MCLTPAVRTGELFDLLRDGRPWTRAQLAEATGLARSTITARIDTLMRLGLVAPFGGARSTGGRPPARPKLEVPTPTGNTNLGKGTRVRHPKYGEGVVVDRLGDGEDAKLTVQFQGHGVKKLVEKFAQLSRL